MIRIGEGWDIHQLEEGRPLIIGGVELDWPKGARAHSDGDVLIHALIDALLGAAALGDIGTHFPPSEAEYKDICSIRLLEKVYLMLGERGFSIINIDSTIVLERPRLSNYIPLMREKLASALNIGLDQINIKAKSAEKIGAVGRGEAVEARAIVLVDF